jgi:hypothetical protein
LSACISGLPPLVRGAGSLIVCAIDPDDRAAFDPDIALARSMIAASELADL